MFWLQLPKTITYEGYFTLPPYQARMVQAVQNPGHFRTEGKTLDPTFTPTTTSAPYGSFPFGKPCVEPISWELAHTTIPLASWSYRRYCTGMEIISQSSPSYYGLSIKLGWKPISPAPTTGSRQARPTREFLHSPDNPSLWRSRRTQRTQCTPNGSETCMLISLHSRSIA